MSRMDEVYARLKASGSSPGTTDVSPSESANYIGDHRFPGNLENINHWVNFSFHEYSRASRHAQAVLGASLGNVTLPMPSNIQTKYGADYTNISMGLMGNFGEDVASNIKSAILAGKQRDQGSIGEKFDSQAPGELITKYAGLTFAQSLDGLVRAIAGPEAAGGVSIGTGLARNPHLAVLYNGVELRDHTFSYRFNPLDKKESDMLRDILHAFKYAQAPDFTEEVGDHLFKYPNLVQVSFNHADYLWTFGQSVIKQIIFNPHAAGQASYFKDVGAPVSIEFTIILQETSIITKKEISEAGR